jgi:hypothetical protein
MKRPAFVGFSEDSEVAEQTPLEKRKPSCLLLIQSIRSAETGFRSRLLIDRQSSTYLEFCCCFFDPVFAVMDYRGLSIRRPQTAS